MRLKPWCGCAVLALALVNLIGFLFMIVFVGGIALSVSLGLVFLVNGLVFAAVGWGVVRARGLKLPALLEGEEGEE